MDETNEFSFEMEASSSNSSLSLECYEEQRVLEELIEAFGSTFSLREIASAFCKVGPNPDFVAEVLYESKGNTSSDAPENERSDVSSSELLFENIANNSVPPNGNNSKVSKPKKLSTSIGTVSSIIGRGYAKRTTSVYEPPKGTGTKPLKLNVTDLPVAEFIVRDVPSDSAIKNDRLHKDIEDFLFQMLGSGFQLDMDVIRHVLGCCGYDAEKSMEELVNMSASSLKNKDVVADSTGKVAESQKTSEVMDFPQSQDKRRYDLQKEVLASLFGVPERIEEVPRRRPVRIAALTRPGRTVIFEPPKDEFLNKTTAPTQDTEDEEDDTYEVLRQATKEHWITMKEYFKAAFDAFANGDRALADEFLKQGQHFNNKAREADEKSSQLILESEKKNQVQVMVVDLRDYDMKMAIRTLKFYISSLSGIPSQRLQVILFDPEVTKKRSRRTKVVEILERESLKWSEESHGTIMVELDGINPESLSFYGERRDTDNELSS